MLEIFVDRWASRVRVVGVINAKTYDMLDETLRELLDSGISDLTLDLSGVTAITSTGVGTLIYAHSACQLAGGKLHIENASPAVKDILRSFELAQWFGVDSLPVEPVLASVAS